MNKLAKKVAVISGGNSGIGLATAKLYREQGATVVITASSKQSFEVAQAEYGELFDVVQTDVTGLKQIQSLARHVKDSYGHVDILFANAGVAYFAPLPEITPDFFDKQFNINVKGVLFFVQSFASILAKDASVILTTSGINTKGVAGASVYAATKAAVRSLARTLSAELVQQGVRVNALSPGPVETPIYGKMGMSQEQIKGFAQQIEESTPVGRFGQPDEIARAALFLGSDDSRFMLGAELIVDGGFSQL